MSLKAKLEAVVYAAEEPVTLAQLAAIFAEEVSPELDEAAEPATEQIALDGLAAEAMPLKRLPRVDVAAPAVEDGFGRFGCGRSQ